ncbi:unnamed protein product [Prorocentrum cordatum]|uniref:sphingomyelin phosphodiesterase n=1 Tax=Prorocentrum cordatum TaxID=2364126 RepID=A0ABN9X5Q3_9DINO|nr:unnamed protein product [Polarella glacialis]
MEQKKHDLEEGILCMKLEVQTALATSQPMLIDRVVEVLGANLQFRRRCQLLGQSLEYAISSARMVLRSLGERPDIAPLDAKGGGVAKRWRVEFDEMRQTNHAMIGALRHPDATMALPGTALEEQIDHNWPIWRAPRVHTEYLRHARGALPTCKERARELLEAQLPALLECKLAIQQCAAVGAGVPDAELVGRSLASAQAAQAEAREFLTSNEVDVSDIVPTKFVEEMLPHPAAFQKYKSPEAVGGDHYLPVLRLLTYNIFIRAPAPQFTHNTDDDRKDERLSRFVEHLSRYDVVCLQEAFGSFSHRIDWLVGAAREQGFHEFHRSTTNVWPRYFIDGGLMIMSRLPIVARSATTFEPGTYIDRLTAKGALHAKVRCGTAGPFLHVCTTHLQSTYNEETFRQSSRVRRSQIGQLVHFLRQAAPPGWEMQRELRAPSRDLADSFAQPFAEEPKEANGEPCSPGSAISGPRAGRVAPAAATPPELHK